MIFIAIVTAVAMSAACFFYSTPFLVQIVLVGVTLMLQDGLRYAVYASGRIIVLLIGDLIWLAASSVFAFLAIFAQFRVTDGLLTWNLIAVLASTGLLLGAVSPVSSLLRPQKCFTVTRRVSGWSGLQFLLANGLGQASLAIMVLFLGTRDFAGFRAVQMVISPLIVAVLALSSPLVSLTSSQISSGKWRPVRAFRFGLFAFILLIPASLLIGFNGRALIVLLPGKQYVEYDFLFLPALAGLIFVAANVPVSAALLALGRGRDLFVASIVATLPSFLAVVCFTPVLGLDGAAWAMTIQYPLIFIFSAVALRFPSSRIRRSPGRRYRVDGYSRLEHD